MQETTNKILINRKKLLAMIPLSERTIFNMEQRGEFPLRIPLTSRNVAWDLAEVEEWIEARKSSGTSCHASRHHSDGRDRLTAHSSIMSAQSCSMAVRCSRYSALL